jgi:membrane associated rhomboid family serine protease
MRLVTKPALYTTLIFVISLWIIQLYVWSFGFEPKGIYPKQHFSFVQILNYPLFHGGWVHLIMNTYSLFPLMFIMLSSYFRAGLLAMAIIWIGSGIFIWNFGEMGSMHIGASGLVYGFCAYLVANGFLRKDDDAKSIAIFTFLMWGIGMITGFAPEKGVSWEGHFGGAIFGVISAIITRNIDVQIIEKPIQIKHNFERFDVKNALKEIDEARKIYEQKQIIYRYYFDND